MPSAATNASLSALRWFAALRRRARWRPASTPASAATIPTHCSAPGRSPSKHAREHGDDRAGGDDRRDDAHRPDRERAVEAEHRDRAEQADERCRGRSRWPSTPWKTQDQRERDQAASPGRRARPSRPGACGWPGRRGSPRCPRAATRGAPRRSRARGRRGGACTASSSRRIRSGLVPAASTSSYVSSCSAIAPASSGWPFGQAVDRDRRHVELGDRGAHVARRACRAAARWSGRCAGRRCRCARRPRAGGRAGPSRCRAA